MKFTIVALMGAVASAWGGQQLGGYGSQHSLSGGYGGSRKLNELNGGYGKKSYGGYGGSRGI